LVEATVDLWKAPVLATWSWSYRCVISPMYSPLIMKNDFRIEPRLNIYFGHRHDNRNPFFSTIFCHQAYYWKKIFYS
jgi:hypothetical protein